MHLLFTASLCVSWPSCSAKYHKESSNDSIFLHALAAQLSVLPTTGDDLLADDDFCQVLFKFLIPGRQTKYARIFLTLIFFMQIECYKLSRETAQRHLLRLLLNTCRRVPQAKLKSVLLKMESKGKKASSIETRTGLNSQGNLDFTAVRGCNTTHSEAERENIRIGFRNSRETTITRAKSITVGCSYPSTNMTSIYAARPSISLTTLSLSILF